MPNGSRFRWDEAAGRYRDAGGRFVAERAVRREVDRTIRAAERRIDTLARQLQRRELTVADWELGMRREIKRLHVAQATAAKGGHRHMAPADYGRVGQLVRTQYKFLNNFATQITGGAPLDGRFLRRVQLYAQAGRTTYEHTRRVVMVRSGMSQQRSVLGDAEHCAECVEEAAKGWGPIGHVKQVGTRQCLSRCKCSIEYRR